MIRRYIKKIRVLARNCIFSACYNSIAPNPVVENNVPGMSFLVISPHPDDEIIGAGGLILTAVRQDKNVRIVYQDPQETVRRQEAAAVCGSLDIPFEFSEHVSHTVARLLKEEDIDTIVFPHFLDNHTDHIAVCTAVRSVLASVSRQYRVILYEVWTPLIPNLILDISTVFAEKMNLLRLYASQLRNKDYIHGITGLNSYRSLLLHDKSRRYAEAFLLFHNHSDFLDLFRKWNS